MADQITVIDLVEDELECGEPESYLDKIVKFETRVSQMEQEIGSMKEVIVDFKNSFTEDSEGYPPIHTVTPPTFDPNAQFFSNMHPALPNETFSNLAETSKNRENGGRHFNVETNQVSFTNELASQFKTNFESPHNLIPMYDGVGNPLNHLKAYLDWLTSIGQDNELKMRLFVRTLTGSALIWYAKQDTWKWSSWSDLVKDFVEQYWSPNNASRGVWSTKRKFSPKGKATIGPRFIASNLPSHTIFASTHDIAGWNSNNGFIEEDY